MAEWLRFYDEHNSDQKVNDSICTRVLLLHPCIKHFMTHYLCLMNFLVFSIAELEAEVSRLFEDETKQIQTDKKLAEDFEDIFDAGSLLCCLLSNCSSFLLIKSNYSNLLSLIEHHIDCVNNIVFFKSHSFKHN